MHLIYKIFNIYHIQVCQVPESSEGIFGHCLNLITFNEPVKKKVIDIQTKCIYLG